MKSDIDRWDEKHAASAAPQQLTPDPLLIEYRQPLRDHATGGGAALDLACGKGHNGLYLAQLGFHTVLCDGSFIALKQARQLAATLGVEAAAFVADLDHYPLPIRAFDALVVVRFLERGLIESIKCALRPGGILIYKTFNDNWLRSKPDFPAQYVLRHGELRQWFAGLECIASNDGRDNPSADSHWVGRKPN